MDPFPEKSIALPNGINLHLIDTGLPKNPTSPYPIIFCHGWPECSYSWRHQIRYLFAKGYRCLSPDQRGYGDTTSPKDKSQYTLKHLSDDLLGMMDILKISKAILVGHDWGAPVVWGMTQHYPDRVFAVVSLVVPFYPPNPKQNPLKAMLADPGRFDYQLYLYTDDGKAESEFDKDILRSLRCTIRSTHPADRMEFSEKVPISLSNVRQRGGMLVGYPTNPSRTVMWTEEVEQKYLEKFKKSGFKGSINWYRNFEENWKWNCEVAGQKVNQPALMITVGKDKLFPPSVADMMKPWIPRLTVDHIAEAGHFAQQECPDQLNAILWKWLKSIDQPSKL